MSSGSKITRLRVPLSRGLSPVLGLVVLFSASKWEGFSVVGEVFFLIGSLLVGIASGGRMWCSLYLAGYRTKSLVTVGPYSTCRNPLYFFSLLGALGVGLATETLLIPFAVLMLYAAYYPAVIRGEESKLLSLHGDDFRSYCQKTPAFVPRLSLLNEPESYVVKPRIYRKHMLSALWFIWLLGILEMIEAFREIGVLPVFLELY